jgi:hypothetical protein
VKPGKREEVIMTAKNNQKLLQMFHGPGEKKKLRR